MNDYLGTLKQCKQLFERTLKGVDRTRIDPALLKEGIALCDWAITREEDSLKRAESIQNAEK